jgi:hypothetical protein
VPEAVAVGRHHGGFRQRKEAGYHKQDGQRDELDRKRHVDQVNA